MKKKIFFIVFGLIAAISAANAIVKTETFKSTSGFSWRFSDYWRVMSLGDKWFTNIGRCGGAGYMEFTPAYGYESSFELAGRFTGTDAGANTWAYLRTDTLTGGIDSLAFEWESFQTSYQGSKLKFLVQICTKNNNYSLSNDNASLYSEETLSNDTVIYTQDKWVSGSNYYAYTVGTPHHVFSHKNIHIKGKYVIKIWDLSYSLNSNGSIATTNTNTHRFDIANVSWKSFNVPIINYTTPKVFTKGFSISPLIPTNTGGAVNSYSINPELPAGLSFDTSTGEISGVPTEKADNITYTITATNSEGSSTFDIVITVSDTATDIDAIHGEKEFLVYPSVSSDVVNIKTTEKLYSIKVINQLGATVLKSQNSSFVPLKSISNGLYFIEITSSKGQKTIFRFVKK